MKASMCVLCNICAHATNSGFPRHITRNLRKVFFKQTVEENQWSKWYNWL